MMRQNHISTSQRRAVNVNQITIHCLFSEIQNEYRKKFYFQMNIDIELLILLVMKCPQLWHDSNKYFKNSNAETVEAENQ